MTKLSRLAVVTLGLCIGFLLGDILGTPAYSQLFVNSSGKAAGAAHYLSAGTTNSTLVKTGQATLYSVHAVNTNAATAYLKFYNAAVAPTCNSSPIVATFVLIQNIPLNADLPNGATVGNGLGFCITGAAADNDNTNATTGITLTVTYK